MKLDENYTILKDEYSYQLVFSEKFISKRGKNEGKEVESKKVLYYPTLERCLLGYVSEKADPNGTTVQGLIGQLEEIKETIVKLLKEKK